jgi:hypothetical protein
MAKHLITRVCIAVALMNEINGLNRAREAQGALVRAGASAFSSLCFSTTNPTDSMHLLCSTGSGGGVRGRARRLRSSCARLVGGDQALHKLPARKLHAV